MSRDEAAARRLGPADRRSAHQVRQQLRHIWTSDSYMLRLGRSLEQLFPGTVACVYTRGSDGALGEIAHNLRSRFSTQWEDIPNHDRVVALRQYALRGGDPFANRAVDTDTLYHGRAEELDRFRQQLIGRLGLWHQLRVALYDGERFVAYCGVLRGRREGEFGQRERDLFDAITPVINDGLLAKQAIGHAPMPAGTLEETLEAFGQPAFLVTEDGTAVYATHAAARAFPSGPPDWVPEMLPTDGEGGLRSTRCARVVPFPLEGRRLWLVVPHRPLVPSTPPDGDGAVETLPPKLAEVTRLVAGGLSDKEVAEAMDLSVATVRTYVQRVYKRLGVHSRTELAHRARRTS